MSKPSPKPGDILRHIDGSVYRVTSRLENPDGYTVKLATLQGVPVPTPSNFHPVGSTMLRFASWMRLHLAYNKDFDLYINAYIEMYNQQHPKNPLPYPIGRDGQPFRWADWFRRIIEPKLFVHDVGVQAEAQKDELIHEMLFTVLGHRDVLSQFVAKQKKGIKLDTLADKLTSFLISTFMYRVDEMQNKYKEKNPEGEISMVQPSEDSEGDSETNILETEEYGVGAEDFQSVEAQQDVEKFLAGFSEWANASLGETVANGFVVMFDLFWKLLSQGSDVKRGDLEGKWISETGRSFGSFKDYFSRMPDVIEQYITAEGNEMGEQNTFVRLMDVIRGERKKRLTQERRQKQKSKPRAVPAMASALAHAAGIEGDIAEAIGETVSPDSVDSDIKQPTEAMEVFAAEKKYPVVPSGDGDYEVDYYDFPKNWEEEETQESHDKKKAANPALAPNAAQMLAAIRSGDRVTILRPAGMGRDGQEWKEATGKAVMRGSHGWVLNMGGAHGTPGIANEENIVAVRKARQSSVTKTAKLMRGDELTPEMIQQVKAAFIYRWTNENQQRGSVYQCAKCDVAKAPYENSTSAEGHTHPTIPLQSDDQWIAEHAFYFLNDGRLDPRKRHAEPIYLAQKSAATMTADLQFAIEKSARHALEGPSQLACCGGWHNRHKPDCSVYNKNFDETVGKLKSLGKRGMLGHDICDADGQAIRPDTEDTGRSPHAYKEGGGRNIFVLDADCPEYKQIVRNVEVHYNNNTEIIAEMEQEHFKKCTRCQRYSHRWMAGKQGKIADTLTSQTQNVTDPFSPGKSEPMAVPEAQNQAPGPHSPNAPATAPRTPGIQPKIVNVPNGTVGDDPTQQTQTASTNDDQAIAEYDRIMVLPQEQKEMWLVQHGWVKDKSHHGPSWWMQKPMWSKTDWEEDIAYQETDDAIDVETDRFFGKTSAAAVMPQAAPVLPNVVQNQNIVRPAPNPQMPGGVTAIMPGQDQEQGGIKRHTVEPDLPNAQYHMQGAMDLLATEEERLAKKAGLQNTFKITFEDGNTIVTGFNGTLEEAQAYYLNNEFNFGDTAEHPTDNLQRGVSVEQVGSGEACPNCQTEYDHNELAVCPECGADHSGLEAEYEDEPDNI